MYEYEDNSILVVPNSLKDNIIKDIRKNNKELNIKVFSLDEFIKRLTFDYDEKTIYEITKRENVNYNIAKLYLDNICYVNDFSNVEKLNKLYDTKIYIDKYLIKDRFFKKLLNNKNVYIYGYDYITKYQQYVLNGVENVKVINKEYRNFVHKVYRFDTLENEVIFVAESIAKLVDDGIDINNIFIANADTNYYNVIKRIFNMYNIPINLNDNNNLFQTHIGKYFITNLNNNIELLLDDIQSKFDMNIQKNKSIYNKLVDVINKFYFINDYVSVKDNIINVMKNTYIESIKYNNAVNEIDLLDNIIDDKCYVFLVGFNLNKIPITIKDESYITDNIKPDFLEKSFELNILNKEIYYKVISSIKNLIISYKEKYLNEAFYPSLLIDEYKMETCEYDFKFSKYSNLVNKITLTKSIDDLIKFNIYNNSLGILYNNYKIPYMCYDNKFSGINKNNLYRFLNNNLNLSYSSMDNYYHCAFKFYVANILKLDCFESSLQTYIGNLYHYVLSKAYLDDFDFDNTVKYYIENNPYERSFKNDYFIDKVLDELKFVIKTIEYQNTLMNMDEANYEKKVNVDKTQVININFKGFIDKILRKDKFVVIIDYKTYTVDINLNYLPYGLSMQLPVYLYLTKNIDKDYKIIGFYLQQILFGKVNKNNKKTLKELKRDNLKLKGYSIGNEDLLYNFDSTLENSELIYGMKLTSKGFGAYSKVLTDKQIDNIISLTDDKINECIDNVINANFVINPKMISGKNIGCEYCKYKDICYMTNRDIKELDDIKDLSFLD